MSTQTPQSERDVRIAKAQALRAMGINPYAQKFDKKHMIGQLIQSSIVNPENRYVLVCLINGDQLSDLDQIINYSTAIITNDRGQIYLVWNKKHGFWQAPSGKCELGENPLECLERELQEEIGCSLVAHHSLGTKYAPLGPSKMRKGHFYHIMIDREPQIQPEEVHKLEDGQWVDIIPCKTILGYAIKTSRGIITDPLDIIRQFRDNIYAYKTVLPVLAGHGDASIELPEMVDASIEYAFVFDTQEKKYFLTPFRDYQKLQFRDINDIIARPRTNIATAGRLMLYRTHGKLAFGKLMDESGEIQVMWHKDACELVQQHGRAQTTEYLTSPGPFHVGEGSGVRSDSSTVFSLPDGLTPYKLLEKYIDVGDFLGVRGELFYTHKGELTLFVSEWMLLSKAIRPLGDKFHGIGDDKENAYRQRYLDMIFNRETLERMKLKAQFLKTLREFYRSQGFIELETPILGTSASGAAAQPFITHHNDFDTDMYLRIAPEIALKMATVGGLEKVFEIGKDFRNEGSSPAHHQEFTVAEHYVAYRSYEDNMRFTEQMFDYLFAHIPQLKKKVFVADKNGIKREVDFTTPRPRIDYIAQIKKDSGIDVSQYSSSDEEKLRNDILAAGHTRVGIEKQGVATMIDYLYKKVTRPKIVGPAFVYNYPKAMQPLARSSDANPAIAEQFQCIVNGREILKAYSELVDPVEQQANFDEQAGAVAKGDEEATKGDDEFVKAMEYGMPCQSGRGMGLDRIFAMLTEQTNIRDVILFPMVKPEHNDAGKIENDQK